MGTWRVAVSDLIERMSNIIERLQEASKRPAGLLVAADLMREAAGRIKELEIECKAALDVADGIEAERDQLKAIAESYRRAADLSDAERDAIETAMIERCLKIVDSWGMHHETVELRALAKPPATS